MTGEEIVKSACGICDLSCGVLIRLKGGIPVKVEGDPEHPLSRGALCPKGKASLEYLNSPHRLKHPLKRTGKRGDGEWERISWDEAWEVVSRALNGIKKESGPESVAMIHGSAKDFIDTHLVRLANTFGTPNVVTIDHVCHIPHMLAAEYTFGFLPEAEYDHPPACVIIWGANKSMTGFWTARHINRARAKGTRLITIDPMESAHARSSDIWLRIRPGSDLALALGMLKVIVERRLYQEDFVREWTTGFDALETHVKDYPPERVAELTWVPAPDIVRAAELYASNSPAHIEMGNAIDQSPDSFQTARAISILMAITGNLDIPGGEIEGPGMGFRDENRSGESISRGARGRYDSQFELRHLLPRDRRKRRVSPYLLDDYRYVHSQSFVRAVLEGDPYPIKAAFIQGSNPLSSWCDAKNTYRALNGLDFLVVSDMFMTPTAAMADVVFPAAGYLEFDGLRGHLLGGPFIRFQPKVAQVGECLSDHEIINGLAWSLGLGHYFWDKIDDFWDFVLEPTGMAFDQVRRGHKIPNDRAVCYRKYQERGFKTPSGKVEIYSETLKDQGFEPMPRLGSDGDGEAEEEDQKEVFPLLCTCRKQIWYEHSGGRQIPSLRERYPEPRVAIHPRTAQKYAIGESDWVVIETRRGRIRQKAALSEGIDPRVIYADYGWWFPEKGTEGSYGWDTSNYNILTVDEPPWNPEVGSFHVRGIPCRIRKA
ncbi:MAG: molybdopterin-dependent oxidoreductase [Deltaproteobacteria bacterium]|nr:molybdopterin-dependent oxidoreductase [Deltaproteobacteria bacterium]